MRNYLASINPFYAAALSRGAKSREPQRPLYARIPNAPRNGSPVPHLTSLYHFHRAGLYGSRKWPGNCGGNLIKDLLVYFRPDNVFDPMQGSGTCKDVCDELGIPCVSSDIHDGFDACQPEAFRGPFDFIWCHPPYWRQKLYSTDPRDLSQAPTLEAFLTSYGQFLKNCSGALSPTGKLAVLMGDYTDRAEGFVPLVYHTKRLAFAAGLRQYCTDIVRFSHGASSSRKVYRSKFIPGLHDTCVIFDREGTSAS